MQMFEKVADGHALVRQPGGVMNVVQVYRRYEKLYIRHKGGYVLICAALGGMWPTTVMGLDLWELDVPGMTSDHVGRPVLVEGL